MHSINYRIRDCTWALAYRWADAPTWGSGRHGGAEAEEHAALGYVEGYCAELSTVEGRLLDDHHHLAHLLLSQFPS